jgi:hypothetical protein
MNASRRSPIRVAAVTLAGSLATMFLVVSLAFAGGSRVASDNGGAGNPRISPPGAHPYGATYAEWDARWWLWAFSIPADPSHPFFPGGNVLQGQTGKVWFLAGVFGGEVRSITIPSGTALYFPIVNTECSTVEPDPFHGGNEAELRACAKGWIDNSFDLAAEIDGTPVQNIWSYRHQSTLYSFGPLGPNNILGVPGASGQSADDGVYLMLVPMSVGSHTIHITGNLGGAGVIDTDYNIEVVPAGSASAGSVSPEVAEPMSGATNPGNANSTWGRVKSIYR